MLVAIASEKGGAGKTTLAVLLAEELHRRGVPFVLADGDPQASATAVAAASAGRIPEAQPVFPAHYQTLADSGVLVLLDLPSGLRDEFYTAANLADVFLIPAAPSVIDLRTLTRTLGVVSRVAESRPGDLRSLIIPVRISGRERASKDLIAMIKDLGWPTTRARLAERSAYRRAGAGGLGALPKSTARLARREVEDLTDEIIKTLEIELEATT